MGLVCSRMASDPDTNVRRETGQSKEASLDGSAEGAWVETEVSAEELTDEMVETGALCEKSELWGIVGGLSGWGRG